MRQGVHVSLAKFRVSPALLSEAQRRAQRDGMTLSELMRAALRAQLREAA